MTKYVHSHKNTAVCTLTFCIMKRTAYSRCPTIIVSKFVCNFICYRRGGLIFLNEFKTSSGELYLALDNAYK